MSDGNAPLPRYTVPPPANTPNSGVPSLVWILVAIPISLFFIILLAAGVYVVLHHSKPRERPGIHQPVIARPMRRGWVWYYLRPIGVAIANTVKPTPVAFDKNQMSRRTDISEYGGYRFAGRHLNTLVYAYYMRNSRSTIESQANYTERRQKQSIPHVIVSWQEPVVVAGLPGRMVVCEYLKKGYVSVTKTAILRFDNITYFFEGTYFKTSEKWSEKAFQYELRTAHIDR